MSSLDDAMFYTLVAGDVGAAAIAIAVYEAVINFDREIAMIWQRKWSSSSTILVVLRLTSILQLVILWANNPPTICEPVIIISESAYLISCLAIDVFVALRVHAISNRNFFLSVSSFVLLSAPRSLDILAMVQANYAYNGAPFDQCFQVPTPRGQYLGQTLKPLGFACFLAGYILILLVTFHVSLRQWLEFRRIKLPTRLWPLLLRYGTMEFIIVTVLEIMRMIVAKSLESVFIDVLACFEAFYLSLPAIIVCRLILSLRQLSEHDESVQGRVDGLDYGSTVVFGAHGGRVGGENETLDGLETDFSHGVDCGDGGVPETAGLSMEA